MKISVRQWLCRLIALVLIAQAPLAAATSCAKSMQPMNEMAAMDCHGEEMTAPAAHSEDSSCCETCNHCATLQSTVLVIDYHTMVESFHPIMRAADHQDLVAIQPESPFRPPIS